MIQDSWGYVPPFAEYAEHVHPDDRQLFLETLRFGTVWQRVSSDGDYLRVSRLEESIRVAESIFQPVPPPPFTYGDRVVPVPPRTPREGIVADISWHFEDEAHIFYIRLVGRQHRHHRHQYRAHELELVVPSQ